MYKLAIIVSHPIQYYVPVFRLLGQTAGLEIMVFYTWGEESLDKYDPGFKKMIRWDIPLMDGYPYQWVENIARDPGTHHFKGIINPYLKEDIEKWGPDALLVFGWSFQSHLKLMRHFKDKIPVYFRGDSTLLDNQKGIRSMLRWIFLKCVYKNIDHAFYTGTQNKAYFNRYGLKEEQLTFAPHGIHNQFFSKIQTRGTNSLRAALKIRDNEVVILFAGKFEKKKDPEILLRAVSELENPSIHLLMVGNGPIEKALKTRNNHSPHVNIHWMDFQNQSAMPAIYQACDLFCLPSQGPGESWGLAVNEAMAAGKPVLVSDKVGCAVDLVIPGVTGEIFTAGDIDDLKQKLKALTSNKSALAIYGLNSAERIKNWSLESQVEAITNTLIG